MAVLLAALLTGCIGATARSTFDREVQERSGGVSGELLDRALAAVADHLGTDRFSLRAISVEGRGRIVSMEVQDPRQPDHLDTYRFHDDDLEDPRPILLSGSTSMELTTFRVADVPALADVRELVDATRRRLDIDDGLVTLLAVRRNPNADIEIVLDVTSERAAGQARFDAAGMLLGATWS
ncbi:hypothetical protein BH10ACT1_BH10ACT1_36360 [soil metagenome]